MTRFIWLSSVLLCTVSLADFPPRFDASARLETVRAHAVKDAMNPANDFRVRTSNFRKTVLSENTLILIQATYEGRNAGEFWRYNLSELVVDTQTSAPKTLFQLVAEDACDTKKVQSAVAEKLGDVDGRMVYAVELALKPSSCVNSDEAKPAVFLILQETARCGGVEKIYESPMVFNSQHAFNLTNGLLDIKLKNQDDTDTITESFTWNHELKQFKKRVSSESGMPKT